MSLQKRLMKFASPSCEFILLVSMSCQFLHLFIFIFIYSICRLLPCPLSTCPTRLMFSPSTTNLSAMQTCGSLPGMYCIQRLFLSVSLPPSPFLTSVHAGGALLNRLVASRGIASQRRGHSGTAYIPTFSPREPFLYYLYSWIHPVAVCRCALGSWPHTNTPTHWLA